MNADLQRLASAREPILGPGLVYTQVNQGGIWSFAEKQANVAAAISEAN